jgi:TetR/AcrR family transcriptional repressor for divergent bdcA
MTTKSPALRRGRPRSFDADEAVAKAQRLFHVHGYDGVSVATVIGTVGINPPSFYAAFGSKLALYTQALARYSCTNALPLTDLLREDQEVAKGLGSLLQEAAKRYAIDGEAGGCLVLQGIGSEDQDAKLAAGRYYIAAQDAIRAFIAERHPEHADLLTDVVITAMAGLSAQARNGVSQQRLMMTARFSGRAIEQLLSAPTTG